MKHQQKAPDGFITAKDAAKLLGVCLRTLRAWSSTATIPHYRLGGRCYYKAAELIATLERSRVGPSTP